MYSIASHDGTPLLTGGCVDLHKTKQIINMWIERQWIRLVWSLWTEANTHKSPLKIIFGIICDKHKRKAAKDATNSGFTLNGFTVLTSQNYWQTCCDLRKPSEERWATVLLKCFEVFRVAISYTNNLQSEIHSVKEKDAKPLHYCWVELFA